MPCDELRTWTPEHYGERVRARVGEGPLFLSFDIDVLDPAFAPGTGTPEVAGLLPHEALAFLRALGGLRFGGFDVVEVSPQFDGPGQVTALNAASVGLRAARARRARAAGLTQASSSSSASWCSPSSARSFLRTEEWIWEMRDSETPSTWPVSCRLRFLT